MMGENKCEYCGGTLGQPENPEHSYLNAPCTQCGAVANMVVMAKFLSGMKPMLLSNRRGQPKGPGFWVHPETGRREVMTNAEYESLRS